MKIGVERSGGQRADGGQIDRSIGGEMFFGKLYQADFADDENRVIGVDRNGFDEFEGEAEPRFHDERCGDPRFEVRSEAGGGEFRNIARIAGRAEMGLFEDACVNMIDRVGASIEDIG